MGCGSAVASAVAGALLLQVVPLAGPARAAWCWADGPPKCVLSSSVAGGSCMEGAEIVAGGTCTPTCEEGKVPSGACSLQCPPSGDGTQEGTCTEDLTAQPDGNPWWDLCYYGRVCVGGSYELGAADSSAWGQFECVEAGSAAAGCEEVVAPPPVPEPTCWDNWDCPTGLVAAWYVVLLVMGAVLGRLSLGKFFQDRSAWWSPANILAIVMVLLALILYASILAGDATGISLAFLTGLAAGLALPLPLVFAFYRAGAEDILKMSRERAWRVHAVLGWVALAFSTAHGVVVFKEIEDPLASVWWGFGMLGLVLMWIGVVATPLATALPILSYDTWKLLHFASAVGYVFAVLHMLDHAIVFGSFRSWLVTILSIAAVAVNLVQKVMVMLSSTGQSLKEREVLQGSERYVTLSIEAPKFAKACKPGQWGHLTFNGVLKHPFTCTVTKKKPDTVELVIKVSGKWTSKLAEVCSNGSPSLQLEGPYGVPPLPDAGIKTVVFVLGGVGVTPALSLVPLAHSKECQIHLFWSMRSAALLEHCAPFFEEQLDANRTCISVTTRSNDQSQQLPLGAKRGRQDVGEWLRKVDAELSGQGEGTSVLVFVCGPQVLANATWTALGNSGARGKVDWRIHMEQFSFLPPPPARSSSGQTTEVTAQLVGAPM